MRGGGRKNYINRILHRAPTKTLRSVGLRTISWETTEVRTACDMTSARRLSEMRLPHVRRSPSAVQEYVLGRPKVLRSFWYRSLGSTDEFPGAWAPTIFLTILMKIHKLVQGSEGHRSENQVTVVWNPHCPMDIPPGMYCCFI
jgi:hypothetical protein